MTTEMTRESKMNSRVNNAWRFRMRSDRDAESVRSQVLRMQGYIDTRLDSERWDSVIARYQLAILIAGEYLDNIRAGVVPEA